MSCNYNKPKPTPAVLFQAKIFHFHKMKSVVTGDLIRFLCAAFFNRTVCYCLHRHT